MPAKPGDHIDRPPATNSDGIKTVPQLGAETGGVLRVIFMFKLGCTATLPRGERGVASGDATN
jgi:hypothetical protein